jgi:hypothetical protein
MTNPQGLVSTRAAQVIQLLIGVPLFVIGVGFWNDLLSGLALSRTATSLISWGGLMLAGGGVYLAGEAGAELIGRRDQIGDPLWKRLLHLIALLAFIGVLFAFTGLLHRAFTGRWF